jgi:hypothetical protein
MLRVGLARGAVAGGGGGGASSGCGSSGCRATHVHDLLALEVPDLVALDVVDADGPARVECFSSAASRARQLSGRQRVATEGPLVELLLLLWSRRCCGAAAAVELPLLWSRRCCGAAAAVELLLLLWSCRRCCGAGAQRGRACRRGEQAGSEAA